MLTPRFNTTQESKESENHDRELVREVIDGLRLIGMRARTYSDEAQSIGLRIALSSIGAVCDAWLKSLQHALHLSFPETKEHFETLTEEVIAQPSSVSSDNWRPGDITPSED